jgi:hypothetical protein
MCTCLLVKRELAAENMLLKQQLEDKKHLVRILKKESMLQKAELRFRDRKEVACLCLVFFAYILAASAMFAT